MNTRDQTDIKGASGTRQLVEKTVTQLMLLSRSEEACRLLGVEGVLVDQVNITILDDALDYVAYDIAASVRDVQEDTPPVQATMLSTLVAELRLCGLMIPRIDQFDLVERVMRQLRELQD